MNNPEITIITVSYNAAKSIEKTILSVLNQTYSNIQYVIIDGNSTDETVDIIRKYENRISYWMSEPDKGIYDAMNKGIDNANGEIVYFLGAGDWLSNKNTISEIVSEYVNFGRPDILCGRVRLICKETDLYKVIGKCLSEKEILQGEMPPHQGMFAKLSLLCGQGFDVTYDICADRDFFIGAFVSKKRIEYTNIIVADYDTTGFSSNTIRVFDQIDLIARKYNSNKFNLFKVVRCKGVFALIKVMKCCRCLGIIRKLLGGWKSLKSCK